MKKLLSAIVSGVLAFGNLPVLTGLAESQNSALWEKFLRYDLCITDYNARSEEEKELCRFIFDTEQAANDNIVCERARRQLAGDTDLGERVTAEELEKLYGIWDGNSSEYVAGWHIYKHCVPDVIHYASGKEDSEAMTCEYWIDDNRSQYVVFNVQYSDSNFETRTFEVFGSDDVLLQTIPAYRSDMSLAVSRTDEFLKELGCIEKNNGYYYIQPDHTAIFVWCKYAESTRIIPAFEELEANPIAEPFVVESDIDGIPVTEIERGAFTKAPLTKIVLPDTIERIHTSAFYNCEYLEEINLPDSLKTLENSAFMYCVSLHDMVIDCPQLKLESNCFLGCDNLKSMDLNVYELGEKSLPDTLETVQFGSALKKVDYDALGSCTQLKECILPSGIEVIAQNAITLPNITSVTIPPTVRIIGAFPRKNAWKTLSGLGDVTATRPLTDNPMCAFTSNCIIKGYEGSEAERYAKEWDLEFSAMEYTAGDVNFDGVFSIADVIALQKWLTEGKEPVYWKAADYHQDNRLTASDFTLMKRALLK